MNKISILIPTYNRPGLLMEAIKSCLEQTYLPYEVIIGDDSPNELTKNEVNKICNKQNVTIVHLHNKPSLGQAKNVNMLFDHATGDKLMLLHDDDLLLPESLETLNQCFEKYPNIKVAYGKQYIISHNGDISIKESEKFNKRFYRTEKYEGLALSSLEAGLIQQFPNDAYLIESNLAKTIKYNNVGDACDFDFGLRVGQTAEKIYFTNQYTAKYRISNEAVSTNSKNNAGITSYLWVKDMVVPPKTAKLKDKWLRERAPVAVFQAIAHTQIKTALQIYFSKYHLRKILTLGGARRILLIINTLTSNFVKQNKN